MSELRIVVEGERPKVDVCPGCGGDAIVVGARAWCMDLADLGDYQLRGASWSRVGESLAAPAGARERFGKRFGKR